MVGAILEAMFGAIFGEMFGAIFGEMFGAIFGAMFVPAALRVLRPRCLPTVRLQGAEVRSWADRY